MTTLLARVYLWELGSSSCVHLFRIELGWNKSLGLGAGCFSYNTLNLSVQCRRVVGIHGLFSVLSFMPLDCRRGLAGGRRYPHSPLFRYFFVCRGMSGDSSPPRPS